MTARLWHLCATISTGTSRMYQTADALDQSTRDARQMRDVTILDRFELAAAQWPEMVALVFEGARVDYRALDMRANQLAWELIARGVGPEDIVALYLPRGIEMIVGILGV